MKVLDVGCGLRKTEGAIGIDKHKLKGVDVVHDLEKFPWPFKDNTFDKIICSHILEHLTDIIKTTEELHRIAKPNAMIDIEIPHYKSALAYADPTHKHYLSEKTIIYFLSSSSNPYYFKKRFQLLKLKVKREKHRILPDILFPPERIYATIKVIK